MSFFHDVLAEPILQWRRDHEQERARRLARRRFAKIGGVLLALVVVFGALGIVALVQRQHAARATETAKWLTLASNADGQLDTNFDVALLMDLEVLENQPSIQSRGAIIFALAAARRSGAQTILRSHQDSVRGDPFRPNGKRSPARRQ